MDVVAAAYPQLAAHVQGLAHAKLEATGALQRWGERAKQVTKALSVDLAGEGVDMLADVAGIVPGANLVVKWSVRGARQAQQHLQTRAELADTMDMGRRVDQTRVSAAEELAGTIRDLAHPGIPQIVVIEDLHRMGPDLTQLLQALAPAVPDRPVLVVGTAWPEGAHNREYREWMESASSAGHLELVAIAPLVEADLVKLVLEHAPATDMEAARVLAARMPSPHLVKLWLTSAQVQRRIARTGGRIDLAPGELDRLPASARDVVQMRWNELPASVRSALIRAVASRIGDATSDSGTAAIPAYDPLTVARAAELAGVGHDELMDSLQHAVAPLSWCLNEDDSHWLREHLLLDTVRESLEDDELGLARDEIADLTDAARQVLDEEITRRADGQPAMPTTPHNLTLAQWLLDLAPPREEGPTAVQAAAFTIALQRGAQYRYVEALDLVQERFPHPSDVLFPVRYKVAEWLGETGRVNEAVTHFTELLSECTRVVGPDHPSTLDIRGKLASGFGELGRVQEAVAQFESLLADCVRVLGADHLKTLSVRNNLAIWLGRAGRMQESVAQLEQLLADHGRLLGLSHPGTLSMRSNVASGLARVGRVGEALARSEELLIDRSRILGSEHPDTLATRDDLAILTGEVGRVGEAVARLEELLVDRVRVLGSDHPLTLITRNNLAYWCGQAGRVGEAVVQFEQLLVDRTRVLGS
ncbi:tetratricopeptide repeat protein, partial [Serinicoccus kebangsaanensis]|uniref:tetratricopeptide repeat protein n=1 Tax=Serinicoccus kebangsaanensis TaxID=2602069 RepID=UPI00349E61F8